MNLEPKSSPNCRFLRSNGYCVMPSALDNSDVVRFRTIILNNLNIMGQTRNISHSFHLAGFHRFQELSGIHQEVISNNIVSSFLADYYNQDTAYAIGLTDITINRSQHWHTDLLRGEYSSYLANGLPWQNQNQSCIKILIYLQAGKSLRIVPKSHLLPTPLDDTQLASQATSSSHIQLGLNAGDIVLMDIRALHRGSNEDEMSDPKLAQNPKILVSTVFGATNSIFAKAMQIGNNNRMKQWDKKYLK